MLNRKLFVVALGLLPALHSAHAETTVWDLDNAHTSVNFSVRHMMISKVKGTFKTATGTLKVDDKDLSKSSADFTIDAKSIDTGNEKRDEHLRSADFFDTAKFPTITFKSGKVEKKRKSMKVHGFITMHGQTKPLMLEIDGPTKAIRDPFGLTRSAVSATAKINRKDFGLQWNQALEAGGVAVGEEVDITIEAEFVKKDGATTPKVPATQPAVQAGEPAPKKAE